MINNILVALCNLLPCYTLFYPRLVIHSRSLIRSMSPMSLFSICRVSFNFLLVFFFTIFQSFYRRQCDNGTTKQEGYTEWKGKRKHSWGWGMKRTINGTGFKKTESCDYVTLTIWRLQLAANRKNVLQGRSARNQTIRRQYGDCI